MTTLHLTFRILCLCTHTASVARCDVGWGVPFVFTEVPLLELCSGGILVQGKSSPSEKGCPIALGS